MITRAGNLPDFLLLLLSSSYFTFPSAQLFTLLREASVKSLPFTTLAPFAAALIPFLLSEIPLPPLVQNGTIFLPFTWWDSKKVRMIIGSFPHQIGYAGVKLGQKIFQFYSTTPFQKYPIPIVFVFPCLKGMCQTSHT